MPAGDAVNVWSNPADMAHVWLHEPADTGGEWTHLPLDRTVLVLGAGGSAPVVAPATGGDVAAATQLLRRTTADGTVWLLLGTDAVRVNGSPLDVGLRVLRDQDELVAAGRRMFFSTETLAVIVPLPVTERAVFCPRCKLEIAPGSPAVACPQCGVWHHQSDDYPCWTYAERCTLCDQPSALDAGYRWTPDDL